MPITVDATGSNIPQSSGLSGIVKFVDGQPIRVRPMEAPIVFESTYTNPQTGEKKKNLRFVCECGLQDKTHAPLVGPITLLREITTQMSLQGKSSPAWSLEDGCWLIILARGQGKDRRYSVSVGESNKITNPETIAKIAEFTKKNNAWAATMEGTKVPASPASIPATVPAPTPVQVPPPTAPTGGDPLNW